MLPNLPTASFQIFPGPVYRLILCTSVFAKATQRWCAVYKACTILPFSQEVLIQLHPDPLPPDFKQACHHGSISSDTSSFQQLSPHLCTAPDLTPPLTHRLAALPKRPVWLWRGWWVMSWLDRLGLSAATLLHARSPASALHSWPAMSVPDLSEQKLSVWLKCARWPVVTWDLWSKPSLNCRVSLSEEASMCLGKCLWWCPRTHQNVICSKKMRLDGVWKSCSAGKERVYYW